MVNYQSARLIGGAGTGKTTELLAIMEGVIERLECCPSLIGFASLTTAAREEMVSRACKKFGVSEGLLSRTGWFRTVHSSCRRLLGLKDGEIISGDNKAMRWIAKELRVDLAAKAVDGSDYQLYIGDNDAAGALQLWSVARNRVMSLRALHDERNRAGLDVPGFGEVRHFIERYERAKAENGLVDFVDVLARYAGVRFAIDGPEMTRPEGGLPDEVVAWIFDEYQDSSKLLDLACRRLVTGRNVKYVYMAADPFQSIFGFGGADFRNFMSWEVDKQRTMPQSWRCPRPVMDLGERCLRRMKDGYFDRGISPATHDGRVVREPSIDRALFMVDPSRTTLILARCKYILDECSAILKARKIPHATLNQDGNTKSMVACNAFWKLQHGKGISNEEMAVAVESVPAGGRGDVAFLKRGVKAAWKNGRMAGVDYIHPTTLESLGFMPALQERIVSGEWASLVDKGRQWYDAAKKFGPEQATNPNVRLSTIHGAKGMEAQDVIMATATSKRIENERSMGGQQHDEECRIEYVGVTRAREQLIVCDSDAPHTMSLPY